MKKIIVKIPSKKTRDYPIFIGNNLLEKTPHLIGLSKYSKVFIITDQNIEKILLKKLLSVLSTAANTIVLPSSEKEKNITNIQKVWKSLIEKKYDRKSLVINLGGGVIGDLGGFAAATFMRGVDFINIPTTLLSQVDASVGGKTGIDFLGIKNLIGTFSQPKAVLIDIDTLSTLPKREFLAGFAEIIKHGLIKDKKYFNLVTAKHPLEFNSGELIDIVFKSIQLKKEVVESDETESNDRKILNFGHTVGHAIESLSLKTSKPFLHGEAISIGIFIETKISSLIGLLSSDEVEIVEQGLIQAGLPTSASHLNTEKIFDLMKSDKKNEKGEINLTLLSRIGKAIINQKVSQDVIKRALK